MATKKVATEKRRVTLSSSKKPSAASRSEVGKVAAKGGREYGLGAEPSAASGRGSEVGQGSVLRGRAETASTVKFRKSGIPSEEPPEVSIKKRNPSVKVARTSEISTFENPTMESKRRATPAEVLSILPAKKVKAALTKKPSSVVTKPITTLSSKKPTKLKSVEELQEELNAAIRLRMKEEEAARLAIPKKDRPKKKPCYNHEELRALGLPTSADICTPEGELKTLPLERGRQRMPYRSMTNEMMTEICSQIARGKALYRIVKLEGMCSRDTFFKSVSTNAEWAKQYKEAVDMRGEYFADQISELSDEARGQTSEEVQAIKLQVNTRQWLASKLLPKKYGERMVVAGDSDNPLVTQLVLGGQSLVDKIKGGVK